MRDYARSSPTFWVRGSGKKLKGNPAAQALAQYLFSAPGSNMIGLYYLALPTVAHELGWELEIVEGAMAAVVEAGIVKYDADAELVFMREGARYQIGETLKASDKRVKGVIGELSRFGEHPFVAEFVARYRGPFNLPLEAPSKPLRSPFEAPSELETKTRSPCQTRNEVQKQQAQEQAQAQAQEQAQARPAAAADSELTSESDAILAALRSHRSLAPVASAELADTLAGRVMATGKPLAWFLETIAQAAAQVAGRNFSDDEIQKTVRTYAWNPRKPKAEPVDETKPVRLGDFGGAS